MKRKDIDEKCACQEKEFTNDIIFARYINYMRKALLNIENDKKKYDVRLVYLAILNMFKHRGHFLNANLDDKSGGNLKEYIEMLHQSMVNILNINLKNAEI